MRFTSVFFSIISTLCIPVECIVNGSYIRVAEAPYYVGLVIDDGFNFCGGTIISEHWIVTAAHCIEMLLMGLETESQVAVLSGASTRKFEGTVHQIEKCIVHGNFMHRPIDSDIALIKLKEPISFNEDEQPIEISRDPPKVGDSAKLIGKGREGVTRGSTPVLKITEGTVISRETCQAKVFPDYVSNSFFCVGSNTGNIYLGDSGGPIVINGKLAGITSWIGGNGDTHMPAAYTRVHLFYDWILKHTGLKYQQ